MDFRQGKKNGKSRCFFLGVSLTKEQISFVKKQSKAEKEPASSVVKRAIDLAMAHHKQGSL